MSSLLKRNKKYAWDAFSLYIRTRDCLKTGSLDTGVCITCNRPGFRVGRGCLQAGHFIAGRTNSVLFDERNCHSQCYSCNVGRGGAYVEYFVFMEKNYGRMVIDELRELRHKTVKLSAKDYKDIQIKYEEMTENLLAMYMQKNLKLKPYNLLKK